MYLVWEATVKAYGVAAAIPQGQSRDPYRRGGVPGPGSGAGEVPDISASTSAAGDDPQTRRQASRPGDPDGDRPGGAGAHSSGFSAVFVCGFRPNRRPHDAIAEIQRLATHSYESGARCRHQCLLGCFVTLLLLLFVMVRTVLPGWVGAGSQAFSAASADVDGFESAALYTYMMACRVTP